MSTVYLFISYIVIILIGSVGAMLFICCKKKDLFGGWKLGILVGVFGGILGGFLFNLLFLIPIIHKLQEVPYLKYLLVNPLDINFIATPLGVYVALLLYSYVSDHTERS